MLLVMIGNRPKRGAGEGIEHYQTKTLVAMLADASISPLAKEIGYHMLTLYEFQFIPIELDKGMYQDICARCYSGDVVCLFFHDRDIYQDVKNRAEIYTHSQIQRLASHIINYEIDGNKGHSTRVEVAHNKLRDEQLANKHNIFVHRIPVYTRKERISFIDTLKEDEIIRFYFNHMPKVIA